ncbi:MAG TPA: nucleotidyltransferase family protein [Thermoplasmataceae archaeon]|nr:nucleotidyltransferase family protein [Thermoplasmataceae archaeon]
MIGAILSGGYGKRLKPITDEIPKGLIQIKENYSILDRQIFDFTTIGVREIYFLSGYLGEKIEERYGKGTDEVEFHYLRETKPMGTLYSVRNLISQRDDDDILLRNGDTITDMNFKRFVRFAQSSAYKMIMFTTKMRSPFGIVDVLGDQVTEFREKPLLDHYINAGVYYIKRDAFAFFNEDYHEKDLETTAFPRIAANKGMGAYWEDTLWMGIDSEKDLDMIRKEYSNRVDYSWGYRKTVFKEGDKSIVDYYIKSDEKLSLATHSNFTVRVLKGSGLIRTGNTSSYTSDDVIVGKGSVIIEARTPTILQLIEL